jgi:hypothetical protein
MASLVKVKDSNTLGNQLNLAINQIRDGLAFFEKYDGMRAQMIGVSAAQFGETFGVADVSQAQAMSDRWASIAAGNYAGLSDFLDATIRDTTA